MSAEVSTRTRFRVTEGSCLDCAGDVVGVLRRLPGVADVEVLATVGLVIVEHDGRVSAAEVDQQAARVGLRLAPADARPEGSGAGPWWRQLKLLALAMAAVAWLFGLLAETGADAEPAAVTLYLIAVAIGGVYPARSAAQALRSRRLTISSLLVVAAVGALALGVFEEAALLVVVFSLGEVLEDYASDRARGSIRALMALAPATARKVSDGGTVEVPVKDLHAGDVVAVRPGERLPTDGEVIAGHSAIDQSPVTGESIPVEVAPGAPAFGGTVNGNGALQVRVDREYRDTTLARIIREVEEAQARRGQAQRFADRFGAVYTPAMFALAVAVAVAGPLLGGDAREWIYRALVVLTVSCSCALVISVPVSVVSAITRAARDGILIKGGAYLEALARLRIVAFDKTGTLTQGRPRLVDLLALDGVTDRDALSLAASVEAVSEHPLAGAILAGAAERGIRPEAGANVRAVPGVGVEAAVGYRQMFIGRPNGRIALDAPLVATIDVLEADGKTVVVLADQDRPLAVLAIADELRPDVTDTVTRLHNLGVQQTVMLTGDNPRTAAAVAGHAGIHDWRAGLLPADKTSAVEQLRRAGVVAMVGDGINDAPALATADVGIAMGAAGADVALETADVALMADELTKLPDAVALAQRAVGNIRQNIAMSLAAVAFLVFAALTGLLTLTSGLLLNEGTALLIIANALRLLRGQNRRRVATLEVARRHQ